MMWMFPVGLILLGLVGPGIDHGGFAMDMLTQGLPIFVVGMGLFLWASRKVAMSRLGGGPVDMTPRQMSVVRASWAEQVEAPDEWPL